MIRFDPSDRVAPSIHLPQSALAEFERDLIRERTRPGLGAARARAQAIILHRDRANTIADICSTLRVGRSSLYRCLAEERRQ
jgi:DNA invertase Pin-like site-specific DNA recombinase